MHGQLVLIKDEMILISSNENQLFAAKDLFARERGIKLIRGHFPAGMKDSRSCLGIATISKTPQCGKKLRKYIHSVSVNQATGMGVKCDMVMPFPLPNC